MDLQGRLLDLTQFRPPRATRPRGPATGSKATCMPLPRYSSPRALPYSYIRRLSKVAPTVSCAGKADTNSCPLIPSGASAKQSAGIPRRVILGVFPTHKPVCPRVMFTFSSSVSWSTVERALTYAACHFEFEPPLPSAASCQLGNGAYSSVTHV